VLGEARPFLIVLAKNIKLKMNLSFMSIKKLAKKFGKITVSKSEFATFLAKYLFRQFLIKGKKLQVNLPNNSSFSLV
jgi:hypothetical protein